MCSKILIFQGYSGAGFDACIDAYTCVSITKPGTGSSGCTQGPPRMVILAPAMSTRTSAWPALCLAAVCPLVSVTETFPVPGAPLLFVTK